MSADVRLPGWWEPLATRAGAARRSDFSRWPTPPVGGRRSAVLILLGEDDHAGEGEIRGTRIEHGPAQVGTAGPDVLVLRRAATLRNHAGQPAFPGGGADPHDADAVATALREATEEVGLDPSSTTTVATLPRLWIPVSGYVVTPVLSWWHAPHPVSPVSRDEVAEVQRVPIAELADPGNRLRARHPSGFIGPAFDVRGMLIWGFTAGILNTLLDLGGWTQPWDENRIGDLPPMHPERS